MKHIDPSSPYQKQPSFWFQILKEIVGVFLVGIPAIGIYFLFFWTTNKTAVLVAKPAKLDTGPRELWEVPPPPPPPKRPEIPDPWK